MKRVLVNGEWRGFSDEAYECCAIKGDTVNVQIVSVNDSYYLKAEKYPNGHLVYISSEHK